MSRDFRNKRRRRIFKAAIIEFGAREVSRVACTVRSISETGAGVVLNSPLWFPDEFILVIESDGFRRAGRAVWRRDRKVGIQFAEADTSAVRMEGHSETGRSHLFA